MNLLTSTPAERTAHNIESITYEVYAFVQSRLLRIHELVNTPTQQGDILAAFGTNGVAALQAYVASREALLTVGGEVPLPDPEVFVAQADGSVTYVAPPEPESAPEL